MTTLKDLIEREAKNARVVFALQHPELVDEIELVLRQSLETIAKETANALRGEEIQGNFDASSFKAVKAGYELALQDIAKREEEFFNRDNK